MACTRHFFSFDRMNAVKEVLLNALTGMIKLKSADLKPFFEDNLIEAFAAFVTKGIIMILKSSKSSHSSITSSQQPFA